METRLHLKILSLLEARNIAHPVSYLGKQLGISLKKAGKLLKDEVAVTRLEDLYKICEVLHCEPNDIFYINIDKCNLPQEHPLITKLKPPSQTININKLFKGLQPNEIEEILQQMQTSVNTLHNKNNKANEE
jgi:DNA-binding Xre family transcriptional regulator